MNVTIDTKELGNWQVIINGRISGRWKARPGRRHSGSTFSSGQGL